MAARRARAAARWNEADRRAGEPRRGRSGDKSPPRGIPAGAREAWMVRRPQCLDFRFAPASAQMQVLAKELVALQPDVILAHSTPVTAALQRESRTIPIVFAPAADPIGSGFVASLPRPGGNITGLSELASELDAKELEMLKDVLPRATRIGVLWNPTTPSHTPG